MADSAPRKRGGAAPYRKGAAHERLVKADLVERGFFALRSPQSGSPIDILAVGDGFAGHILWVQCKLANYIRPAEKQAVIDLAREHGGYAILATGKNPIAYFDLETGGSVDPRY